MLTGFVVFMLWLGASWLVMRWIESWSSRS